MVAPQPRGDDRGLARLSSMARSHLLAAEHTQARCWPAEWLVYSTSVL
jgi:hypothetical protein